MSHQLADLSWVSCVRLSDKNKFAVSPTIGNPLLKGSYLEQFISQHYTSYPDTGWPGYVYSGAIEYSVGDLQKLDSIAEGIDSYQEEGRLIKESD